MWLAVVASALATGLTSPTDSVARLNKQVADFVDDDKEPVEMYKGKPRYKLSANQYPSPKPFRFSSAQKEAMRNAGMTGVVPTPMVPEEVPDPETGENDDHSDEDDHEVVEDEGILERSMNRDEEKLEDVQETELAKINTHHDKNWRKDFMWRDLDMADAIGHGPVEKPLKPWETPPDMTPEALHRQFAELNRPPQPGEAGIPTKEEAEEQQKREMKIWDPVYRRQHIADEFTKKELAAEDAELKMDELISDKRLEDDRAKSARLQRAVDKKEWDESVERFNRAGREEAEERKLDAEFAKARLKKPPEASEKYGHDFVHKLNKHDRKDLRRALAEDDLEDTDAQGAPDAQ